MSGQTPSKSTSKPLSLQWGTEMLEVVVGPTRKKFVFHKDLICSQSPFFNALCASNMKEKQTNEYHLPEDDPETFELLMYYVYRQRFPNDYRRVSGSSTHCLSIVKFYILSDKLLLAKEAKIRALDALAKVMLKANKQHGEKATIMASTVNTVIHSTADDCPMRKIILEFMWRGFTVKARDDGYLAECFEDIPVAQVCKSLELLRDTADIGLPGKTLPCLTMAERGQSIADCPEYQVGFLKQK